MPLDDGRELYPLEEVLHMLSMSEEAMRVQIRLGLLPEAKRVPGTQTFCMQRSDIANYLNRLRAGAFDFLGDPNETAPQDVIPPSGEEVAADYDARILRAVKGYNLTPKQLARRAGHVYNAHFRGRLVELRRQGMLMFDDDSGCYAHREDYLTRLQ